MKISPLAVVIVAIAFPPLASAQDESVQVRSTRVEIILSQIMTDKRAVYAQAMQLMDDESRAFGPVDDEYEAKVKKIDDRVMQLVPLAP